MSSEPHTASKVQEGSPSMGSTMTITYWLAFLVAILATKLSLLVVDPTPLFFLGDSASYLHTALTDWIPKDRSYWYGWLVGLVLAPSQSLFAMVVFQCFVGAITSSIMVLILSRHLAAPPSVAVFAGLIYCYEPLLFTFERFILTETVGLGLFAIFLCSSFESLHRRSIWWLLAALPIGVATVSVRATFLPPVLLAASVAGFAWVWTQRSRHQRLTTLLLRLLVLSLTLLAFMNALNVAKSRQSTHDGFFWLGVAAPLVQSKHFTEAGIDPAAYTNLPCPLEDPDLREQQRWLKGCLVDSIKTSVGDSDKAARMSKVAAIAAITDKPLGFFKLAVRTYKSFWDSNELARAIRWDTGQNALPPNFARTLSDEFGLVFSDYEEYRTTGRAYLAASRPWLKLLLLTPALGVLALLLYRRQSTSALVLGTLVIIAGGYLIMICALSTMVVVRYLHPLGFIAALFLATLAAALTNRPNADSPESHEKDRHRPSCLQ